jgi:hypothetical protein
MCMEVVRNIHENFRQHHEKNLIQTLQKEVVLMWVGHAMPQVVSHWLLTVAELVQFQVRSCGFCGGHSSTGAGLL